MNWERKIAAKIVDIEVRQKIVRALNFLLEKEQHLLENDSSERSITGRLGFYLQAEFAEWNVDCEYNLNGHVPKRVQIHDTGDIHDEDEPTERLVFPDVIIHKRGNNIQNLIVFEVKKSSSRVKDDNWDLKKIKAYKRCLEYRFGIFLKLETGKRGKFNGIQNIMVYRKAPARRITRGST